MKSQNRKSKPATRTSHNANPKSKIKNQKPLPLPFMPTGEDAFALSKEHNDLFYIVAFMLQYWLGDLLQRSAAEYAEKKNPRDRMLQTGKAWRTLTELFHLTLTPTSDPCPLTSDI